MLSHSPLLLRVDILSSTRLTVPSSIGQHSDTPRFLHFSTRRPYSNRCRPDPLTSLYTSSHLSYTHSHPSAYNSIHLNKSSQDIPPHASIPFLTYILSKTNGPPHLPTAPTVTTKYPSPVHTSTPSVIPRRVSPPHNPRAPASASFRRSVAHRRLASMPQQPATPARRMIK
ncbi:hypothetical protein DENSPDRAFT_627612 [Dentipellis sp. KUC8613]|nr:hypothetical protein DENSPDRAFT_627612 [Dentipellis sp. KUC8613]